MSGFAVLLLLAGLTEGSAADGPRLLATNREAPFCYRAGGERRWPVLTGALVEGTQATLTARRDGVELVSGERLEWDGLCVELNAAGWLSIRSENAAPTSGFELHIALTAPDGTRESQALAIRPAPPPRPLSYYSDFSSELIHLGSEPGTGRLRPLEKPALDQYFRRLQAQGIARLIVWQSPFPFLAEAANYDPQDWRRYAAQAQAILDDESLTEVIGTRQGFSTWGWMRQMLALRLTPEFGRRFTQSARDHGIALTASYRPFEAALTKYYAVPVFDESGAFLWNFLPLASPTVNHHPDEVGFAHYRTLLARMGREEAGQPARLEFPQAENIDRFLKRIAERGDCLEVRTSPYPPLQSDSWVLVRSVSGEFRLQKYSALAERTESLLPKLSDLRAERTASGVALGGVRLPAGCRYLILSSPAGSSESLELAADNPVRIFNASGQELGRCNVYWVASEATAAGKGTRVAGIPADAEYYSDFQAMEVSADLFRAGPPHMALRNRQLVIDLGADWSVEMLDFTRPEARALAVRELRTILEHAPFDEVFVNTRSHTQLAGSFGDGADGVAALAHYRRAGKPYQHLGIDFAYAPVTLAEDDDLRALAASPEGIGRITVSQPGEWQGSCQSPETPYRWRWARNRAVAAGVRALLADLESAFPDRRIRAVIPERAAAQERIRGALEKLQRPNGEPYGREYYQQIWSSNNQIPNLGEGMAQVDLTGLRTEPVLAGIRFLPDPGPLDVFLKECFADLQDNRGSQFRGPRSVFYEAQETLRTSFPSARTDREARICQLLSHSEEIREVILYEAADWTYQLPLSDADLCGHGFLDRCAQPK